MTTSEPSSSLLGRMLNLLGAAIIAYTLVTDLGVGLPLWMFVASLVALAAWIAAIFVPQRHRVLVDALLTVMVVLGAITTVTTNGVMIVPVAVGILRSVGSLSRPVWHGVVYTFIAGLIVAGNAVLVPIPVLGLLSIEGGLVIAVLAGYSGRQLRTAEVQTRELLEERMAIREQQARADVLAGRQAVARDIHDLLAHSLGGLVVQLDAVEALLEAGEVTDAATRVHDARALAVSGLADARRAVTALRDDTANALDFRTALSDLVGAHRMLGGEIELREQGVPRALPADASTALSRALQESLTNARKHAAGAAVLVAVTWRPLEVELEVTNRVVSGHGIDESGGGHGIRGMAERFERLAGARFDAAQRTDEFVVRAVVRVEAVA